MKKGAKKAGYCDTQYRFCGTHCEPGGESQNRSEQASFVSAEAFMPKELRRVGAPEKARNRSQRPHAIAKKISVLTRA